MKIRVLTFFAAVLLLGGLFNLQGCTGILNPGPPPSRLRLSPPMPEASVDKVLNRQLIVAAPVAGREMATDAILLVFNNREVRVLAGVRWMTPVEQLVERNLLAALEQAKILGGVAGESAGIAADARLLTDIREFSFHYAEEGAVPVAVFEAGFQLLAFSSGKITATRVVKVSVPAGGRDTDALAGAMETALGQGLEQVIPWVASKMRKLP